MSTIPLNQILEKAEQEQYAVGAFNINNDLQAEAIFKASYDLNSPVIVQASKGACAFQGEGTGIENIILLEPVTYPVFIWLMNRSKIIITDSGGVQEEAPSLGKPVLVMREVTERPEAVKAGTVLLVGTNKELIVKETLDLLDNKSRYKSMSELHNPYGDGKASKRIVEFIKNIKQN
jgi:UDP-N-acetylglucosamine 2-epimerase